MISKKARGAIIFACDLHPSKRLNRTLQAVLFKLSWWCDKYWESTAPVSWLMKQTTLSRRPVQNALRCLEACGWIAFTGCWSSKYDSKVYRIDWEKLTTLYEMNACTSAAKAHKGLAILNSGCDVYSGSASKPPTVAAPPPELSALSQKNLEHDLDIKFDVDETQETAQETPSLTPLESAASRTDGLQPSSAQPEFHDSHESNQSMAKMATTTVPVPDQEQEFIMNDILKFPEITPKQEDSLRRKIKSLREQLASPKPMSHIKTLKELQVEMKQARLKVTTIPRTPTSGPLCPGLRHAQ